MIVRRVLLLSVAALALLSAPLQAQPASAPATPGAPPSPPALRVAVLDLQLAEVDARVGGVVADSLLVELRKLDRLSAISMDEVRAMLSLEAEKQLVGCDETSCLAEIADALGVDVLVTGSLRRVGDEHVMALRRIDQRHAQVTGSFQERLVARDGEEFLAAIGPAVAQLFPDQPLRVGASRGVSAEVARRLNPPPLPAWTFWTGVGGAGLALLATGAAAAVWGVLQADYRALAESSRDAPVDGAMLTSTGDRALSAELSMWVLLGSAALIGGVTAGITPLVDFWGYGEERS